MGGVLCIVQNVVRVMGAITCGSCNIEVTTYEDAQRIAEALESCN